MPRTVRMPRFARKRRPEPPWPPPRRASRRPSGKSIRKWPLSDISARVSWLWKWKYTCSFNQTLAGSTPSENNKIHSNTWYLDRSDNSRLRDIVIWRLRLWLGLQLNLRTAMPVLPSLVFTFIRSWLWNLAPFVVTKLKVVTSFPSASTEMRSEGELFTAVHAWCAFRVLHSHFCAVISRTC